MKFLVLASATALATVIAFSPASGRLGIAPTASTQDDAAIQVRAAVMVTAIARTAVAVTTTAGTAGTVTGGTDISGGDWPLATAARLRCDADSAHHRGSREAIDHEVRVNPRTWGVARSRRDRRYRRRLEPFGLASSNRIIERGISLLDENSDFAKPAAVALMKSCDGVPRSGLRFRRRPDPCVAAVTARRFRRSGKVETFAISPSWRRTLIRCRARKWRRSA